MPFKDSEEGQTHFDPKAELTAKFEEKFYPVDMGWLIMEPIEISLEVVKRDKKILAWALAEIQKARELFLRANTNKFIKEYQKDFDGLAGKETRVVSLSEVIGVLDSLKRGINLGGMMEEQMNYAAN